SVLSHSLATHSFPTRRSSDLKRQQRGADGRRRRTCSATGHRTRPLSTPFVVIRTTVVLRGVLSNPPETLRPFLESAQVGREERRSEEHTSELQSRGHLVCRLL